MEKEHKVKIYHLITTLDVGGAEMMLFRLVSLMDTGRFETHVVTLSGMGPVGEKINRMGIPVSALNIRSLPSLIPALIRLWIELIRQKPDILQTWLYHADLVGFLIGRLAGVKSICWNIRGARRDFSEYGLSTRIAIGLNKLFSRFTDAVITNSLAGQKYHLNIGYKPKKMLVIPNGIDVNRFKPDEKSRVYLERELEKKEDLFIHLIENGISRNVLDKFRLVGLIARYAPIKDHATFIKGARKVIERRKDVIFVLAGRDIVWENSSLSSQIPEKYHKHFFLMGERNDIPKITAALDIASLVSQGEGFPNVICEAMACGVPCVVTDVGDCAEIVGDTGAVIPIKSPDAFADAVIDLLNLPSEKLKRLGMKARNRIVSNYTLDSILERYENLYLDIDYDKKEKK